MTEKEVQECEEKQRMVNILMEHGLSAAKSREVSSRASIARKNSAHSISRVRSMVDDYDD